MLRFTFSKILVLSLLIIVNHRLSAQMSGTYNIPGSFSSLSAAVNSLNSVGVSSGVTVNVSAGYSETVAVGGITLTASGSATSPIVFMKSGIGANPQLMAFAGGTATCGSAIQDGIWSFIGSDYITVDGFDLIDQNTSNPSTMEYGFGFFKAGTSNGCQHNLIRNCNITLNRINTTSGSGASLSGCKAINVVNASFAAQTTSILPSAASGGNSYNQFFSNRIENGNTGICLMGYYNTSSTPVNIDTDNQVGGPLPAQSNTIINFGGGSSNAQAFGITAWSQYELLVSNNIINSNNGGGINHPTDLKGITAYIAPQANYTITGNSITLHSGASTVFLIGIENYGNIYAFGAGVIANNLIANCTYPGATNAGFKGIYCGDATTLTVSGNTITNNSTNAIGGSFECINNYNSQGASIATYSNNLIEFGNFNATATSMLVGGILSNVGAPTATINIIGNTFRAANFTGLNGGTGLFYGIRQTKPVNQVTISGNVFDNLSIKSSAVSYLIYDLGQTKTLTVSNNSIVGGYTNSATTGTNYAFYNSNTVNTASSVSSISGNNFSNVTVSGSSEFRGIYQALGNIQALSCTGNTVSNVTAGSGKIYGFQLNNGGSGSVMNGNSVQNLSGGSEIYGMAITGSNSNSLVVSQNTISAFSGSAAAILHGIDVAGGFDVRVLKNKIYDLSTGIANADVSGIFQTTNTSFYATNNCIGDLRAPFAANDNAVKGISIGGGASILVRNNSVLLNGSSSGTNFGSSAIYASTTATLTLQNNLLINRALANGSGKTVAFRRSNSTFSSYSLNSNSNVFFAGTTPGTANCIFYDGTTPVANLSSYKVFAAPRDNVSYTEDPLFTSTVGVNPAFLHLTSAANSVAESNGLALNDVNDDIDNDLRYGAIGYAGTGSSLDIGADEYAGIQIDALGPVISHTNLPTTCSTGDRTLTATIIDASGVPLNGSVAPAIYFKKNNGTYQFANGVLASGSATNGIWSFTINAAAMGGILVNDVISYFVIAQDIAGSPNISSLPLAGLSAGSVTLVTIAPTVPFVYTVTALAGTYSVGSGGNFSTLGAAANAYNTSCLNGPVNFVLTDALYSSAENFPITFLNNTFASVTNSLHVYPSASNTAVITPPTATNAAVLKFTDARYIKVNGLKTGGSAMQIATTNSSTASAGVWIASDLQGCNNLQFSNLEITGASTANVNSFGIISCSNAAAPGFTGAVDNDAIVIAGTSISKFHHGIVVIGSATTSTGSNSDWQIANNILGSIGSNSLNTLVLSGINLQNADGLSVSGNTVSNVYGGGTYIAGIKIGDGVRSSTFTANTITAMRNTTGSGSGSGAAGIDIQTGLPASNLLFTNNMIGDVKANGGSSFTNGGSAGIRVGASVLSGGLKFYNNTVAMNYSNSISGNAGALVSACMFFASSSGGIEIVNNLLYSDVQYTNTAARTYAIYSAAGTAAFSVMNYNDFYVTGAQGVLAMVNTTTVNTLATLQTAFGNNAQSQNIAPVFASSTDLHLLVTSNAFLDNLGTPLPGVNNDIDGQTRSLSLPDIGADEFSTPNCSTISAVSILAPTSYSICSGQSLVLNRSGYTYLPGIQQNWQIGSSAGGPYTVIPSAYGNSYNTPTLTPGTYYYVVANTCSFVSQTAVSNEATVSVFAYPSLSVSPITATICYGAPTLLTASGALNYTWSPANSLNSSSGASVIATPSLNTMYNIIGSNPGGCNNTATININVLPSVGTLSVASVSTLICQGSSANLQAVGTTTVYSVTPISFSPISTPTSGAGVALYCNNGSINTSMTGNLNDGGWSGQGLPFAFNLYGTFYNVFSVSTNGFIQLTGSFPTLVFNGYGIPFPNITSALPAIGAVYANLDFSNSGYINSQVVGSSPNRKLVVNWVNGRFFNGSTGTGSVTTQLILFETSNYIEVHTAVSTGQLPAVEGIQNSSGTAACVVTGRNAQTFSITSNAYRWHFPLTYSWTPSIYLSSTSNSVTTASNVQSNTIYTVEAMSGNGCGMTATTVVSVIPSPTLTISGGTSPICPGTTVSLSASGANTYSWSNGPQTSTYNPVPIVTTTYVVSGTGTLNTCNSTAIQVVTVNPNPTVTISGSSVICVNQNAILTAGGADTFSWSAGPITNTITALSTSSGITAYSVIGTNTLSGCTSSALSTVSVYANPTVAISGTSLICSGQSATLVGSGADTYSWSTGATASSIVPVPAVNTIFTLTGISSPASCTGQALYTISVTPTPTILVTGNNPICIGQSGTLSATGANIYLWSTGATSPNIQIAPLTSTVYVVTGTNSASGCVSNTSVPVTVYPVPVVTIASPGASVCLGSAISFSANGAYNYTWVTTGVNNAILTVTPGIPTTYTVLGSNIVGCVSGKTISIGLFPNPSIIAGPTQQTICAGEIATFTVTGASTYVWMPGNVAGNVFTVSPASTSAYTVTGTDNNNCKDLKNIQLIVDACTGIGEINLNELVKVFPNPSRGVVHITFAIEGHKIVSIINTNGELVEVRETVNNQEMFDLSVLPKGLYYVKISSSNSAIGGKIVVD